MFYLEILHIKTLEDFVTDDPEKLSEIAKLAEEINRPYFHLKEIGVSSKLISDWTKAELINDSFEKGKWRKFSFCEAIWIKFVEELRYFGTEVDDVKELKERLFPTTPQMILEQLNQIKEESRSLNNINEKYAAYAEKYNIYSEQMAKDLMAIEFNFFTSVLLIAIALKSNLAFYVDDIGGYFIDLSRNFDNYNSEKLENTLQKITTKSFALINVSNIIYKFFDNEKLIGNTDFYLSLMNKKEKDVFKQIRSGNYKQIVIKMTDGSITQIRLGKKQDDDLVRKISRLMKKGDFKEINLIVRDGVTVKFEETDIIKVVK
jgi:hypothetical protein